MRERAFLQKACRSAAPKIHRVNRLQLGVGEKARTATKRYGKIPRIDISKLSFDELTELKGSIDRRLGELLSIRRAELVRELKKLDLQISNANGATPDGRKASRWRKGPMYKGPNGETWRGTGMAPAWMKKYKEEGGNRADLINPDR